MPFKLARSAVAEKQASCKKKEASLKAQAQPGGYSSQVVDEVACRPVVSAEIGAGQLGRSNDGGTTEQNLPAWICPSDCCKLIGTGGDGVSSSGQGSIAKTQHRLHSRG